MRVLKHAADKSKESIGCSAVVGFCDSKELFKRKFPDMKPYTREALADRFLHEKYDGTRGNFRCKNDQEISKYEFYR